MSSISPANKRSRTDTDDDNTSIAVAVINPTNNNDTNNSNTSISLENDVISTSEILQHITTLTNDYRNAKPFPHGVISNFCTDGLLEKILIELKHNTKVKFKETDLFRVYQSIDLGNLQPNTDLATKMPSLLSLKNAIYSKSYLQIIEQLTNLPPNTLTNTTIDCAINCHTKGCHLLCHDDVIGTRKISFIIYLTEVGWGRVDGGCLELYDAVQEEGDDDDNEKNSSSLTSNTSTSQGHVPTALPTKTILPNFNTMAYFVVKPGVSFHSVQEVFNVDKPRLSIQGWYHAKEQPDDIENATLQRLKSSGRGEDTEGEFEPLPPVVEKEKEASSEAISTSTSTPQEAESKPTTHNLSEEDINFLSQYMNKAYLSTESMNEIQKRFENESSVQLRHLLLDEWNTKITTAMNKEDTRDKLGNDRPALDYQVGIIDKWKAVGPAHKQRFLQYDELTKDDTTTTVANCSNTGEYLHHIRHTLFKSTAFGKWLGYITSLDYPLGQQGRVRRFRPGLDYTVAHYGVLTTHSVLDATLCFCAGNGEQCTFDEETNELVGSDDDAIWESGDVGGFECYIAADESGEDDDSGRDAEYDDEDDTRLLSVSASNNTLSLVYRDPGTMRFVKYVGSGAPSSRFDIALEYDVITEDDMDDHDSDATEKMTNKQADDSD